MMSVAAEECDDVEVEEGGLEDGDHDGGEAEEAVVEDLLLAEHGVRGFVRLALGGAGGTHVYRLLETNSPPYSSRSLYSKTHYFFRILAENVRSHLSRFLKLPSRFKRAPLTSQKIPNHKWLLS